MFKKMSVVGLILTLTQVTSPALANSTPNIEDQLKAESKGVGRFRGGYYGGIGMARGNEKITYANTGGTKLSGIVFEGGVYGLFNPIRDWVDVEAGIGLKMALPGKTSSSTGSDKYSHGYNAASVYAGPVFRSSNSAVGMGVFLNTDSTVTTDSNDAFSNKYKSKMINSPGYYLEYQYGKPGSKAIYFFRLNYNKYDLKFASSAPKEISIQGKNQSAIALTGGMKF